MSIFPEHDLFTPLSSRARRRAVLATLLVLSVGGGAAYLRSRGSALPSAVQRDSTPAATLEAKRLLHKELIRSVRAFNSVQIVNRRERPFNAYIAEAAAEHRIDPALLRAVIHTESNYAPRIVSRKGARGLMQLLPATASRFGVKRRRLFNPRDNIRAGAAYLNALARRFGDTRAEWIIAAYNAGPGAVERYGGVPPYRETQDYVRRVTERWGAERAPGAVEASVEAVSSAPLAVASEKTTRRSSRRGSSRHAPRAA
jgi:hypothetical protein